MNIICGTDFSERSVRAASVAAGIAKRLEGKLVLVHALEGPGIATADRALAEEVHRLGESGVEVTPLLTIGDPAQELVETAEVEDAPLIVCGSRECNVLGRLVSGNVADRLLEISRIPFLVVRGELTGVDCWALERAPLDVLVGVDKTGIPQVASLARLFALAGDCSFQYEHVLEPEGPSASDHTDTLERMGYRELPAGLPSTTVSSRLQIGDPAAELSHDAELLQTGVLLVGHSFPVEGESVATEILHRVNSPIAIAPFPRYAG